MLTSQSGRSPFADQKRLSGRQKKLIALVGLGSMLEFWDAYLIGFIMAFLIKPWGLTYGVMGFVLLASGVGAVLGGFVWGLIADVHGRKPVFVGTLLLVALASLGLAFTPDGNWHYMAALRCVIGFATGGFFVQVAMVHEFIPPERRAVLTGIVSAITTGGLLLGAFSGAYVIPSLGWRWTFALGAAPAIVGVIAMRWLPESPRWLLLAGRHGEALDAIAWARGEPKNRARSVELPGVSTTASYVEWFEIFRWPRNVLTTALINAGLLAGYYGIVLWTPTLLAQIQGIDARTASKIMIAFSALGMVSRLSSAAMADRAGRRLTGGMFALGAGACVIVAGIVGQDPSLAHAWFWLPLLLGFVLADGSFAVMTVYSSEIWPSRLRGSGAGFAGLCGSVGKIVGPLGLALVAGSSNVVMPSATVAVVQPAFAFLGGCLIVCAATYLLLGVEARGRTLESIDESLSTPPASAGASATSHRVRDPS